MIHHVIRVLVHACVRPLGAIALAAVLGLTGLNVWFAHTGARYVVNVTGSLPLGLYRIDALHGPPKVGDLVLSCLPQSAQIFARDHELDVGADPQHLGGCPGDFAAVLKYVVAVAPQHVLVDDSGVHVDGTLVAHSRPLTLLANGVALPRPAALVLKAGQAFVLAPAGHSFDSRYWGAAIPFASAVPVLTWGGQR